MPDGIAVVDGEQVGTFVIMSRPTVLTDQAIITFNNDINAKDLMDDVGARGLRIELEATPEYGED